MSITCCSGDIFGTEANAIAIPVNCVGVAGAGLARLCKEKYLYWFLDYTLKCSLEKISPELPMTLCRRTEPVLINFPTKIQWKYPSQYAYIEKGIEALQVLIKNEQLESVALPKLGCGLGGLRWEEQVRPLLFSALEYTPCHFFLYE